MVKKESKESLEAKCQGFKDSVTDAIIENFDYFRENPKHLSWAIMNLDLIHRSARYAYDACQDNINEIYHRIEEKLKTKQDRDLLDKAWDVTQMESEDGKYRDGTDLHNDYTKFSGYTQAENEVREDIREKILVCIKNKIISRAITNYLTGRKRIEDILLERLTEQFKQAGLKPNEHLKKF